MSQLQPDWQSELEPHGRVQKPLMQKSMPQSELAVQLFEPGGIALQMPAWQNSPWWQSTSLSQAPLQLPLMHAVPLQSALVLHDGSGLHAPWSQPQVLEQSAVLLQAEPGQPKTQLEPSPSR